MHVILSCNETTVIWPALKQQAAYLIVAPPFVVGLKELEELHHDLIPLSLLQPKHTFSQYIKVVILDGAQSDQKRQRMSDKQTTLTEL